MVVMRVIVMIVAVVVMAVVVMAVVVMAVVVMAVVVMLVPVISCVRNPIAFKQANTHQERKRHIPFDGMKNPGIFFDIVQAFF